MTAAGAPGGGVPDAVRKTLDEFRGGFDLDIHLWKPTAEGRVHLYPEGTGPAGGEAGDVIRRPVTTREGPPLELEIRGSLDSRAEATADVLRSTLEQTFEFDHEIRFFTYEVSERYEEINLLYSISETLGSILRLDEATRVILGEVCDVMGAQRGALWVFRGEDGLLHEVAAVGEAGREGPVSPDDRTSITAQVFREGRSAIVPRVRSGKGEGRDAPGSGAASDSVLSVPIRYTPHAGEARTVGVINLFGRRRGGRFSASDQKLLAAIASQVGAALENNRLIRESLAQERMAQEMALAHNLQQKLLPAVERFRGADVAARVKPAEQVGGDFYHVLRLSDGRIGVMIGDVSTHGFPAALMMAMSLSAAAIYASEGGSPSRVLRRLDDALREELENTEMYLTIFYGVIDPETCDLVYSNAGHPHAFVFRDDGSNERLLATDPPVGFAGPEAYHDQRTSWTPGADLLLLFTDGLSDTLATAYRRSGEEVVLRSVSELRKRSARDVVDALFELASSTTPTIPSDDSTALVLKA